MSSVAGAYEAEDLESRTSIIQDEGQTFYKLNNKAASELSPFHETYHASVKVDNYRSSQRELDHARDEEDLILSPEDGVAETEGIEVIDFARPVSLTAKKAAEMLEVGHATIVSMTKQSYEDVNEEAAESIKNCNSN